MTDTEIIVQWIANNTVTFINFSQKHADKMKADIIPIKPSFNTWICARNSRISKMMASPQNFETASF